ATFHVEIDSNLPVRLSNGDLKSQTRSRAVWQDPWPKPAYLFALVAGDLVAHSGSFRTASGRDVALNIWVRPGDEGKCGFAVDALKRAMLWDEKAYGREYDLDVFNIVSVSDFNAGAMENKGLNIFNSRYVLASPETATDRDYALIEDIIAHEYFHNWTGNRITCRDWFQLCLKEGLTVFREQQFGGDQRGHAVKRIEDVVTLRAAQFREDAGPLAHPVRPASYYEIDNFYTATVYEKGAELIGMLKTLVGAQGYAKALSLYFDRHDGQAATIEDWLAVFQDATDRDLSQFARWYTQAGTPRISVENQYSEGTYRLTFTQETRPTPGQSKKAPQVIPIAVGLLAEDGTELVPTTVLEMTEARQSFTFEGLPSKPRPSLLRGFSAPVILNQVLSPEERAFFMAHDTDPFRKWEAGRQLARDVLTGMIAEGAAPGPDYFDAMRKVLGDDRLDPDFRALMLALPSEDDLAQTLFDASVTPDPWRIHDSLRALSVALATRLEDLLVRIYADMETPGPYAPREAPRRALRGAALRLLSYIDGGAAARAQFEAARNMTEELGAFSCLLTIGEGGDAAAQFYRRWHHDRLVTDKWFALQVSHAAPNKAAATAGALTAHPQFEWKNPNRFRSVFAALISNAAGFHDPSGASYAMLVDWLIKLDPVNPQTAARQVTGFETWRRYDKDRQDLIEAELNRLAATPNLSGETSEMVTRILDG
ncbi:MAG: aminopeptidase N, partial [Alphaproteobacteria bacterium]|nr:aminopeptidase N [Alphaproteobacteria bacterium]